MAQYPPPTADRHNGRGHDGRDVCHDNSLDPPARLSFGYECDSLRVHDVRPPLVGRLRTPRRADQLSLGRNSCTFCHILHPLPSPPQPDSEPAPRHTRVNNRSMARSARISARNSHDYSIDSSPLPSQTQHTHSHSRSNYRRILYHHKPCPMAQNSIRR